MTLGSLQMSYNGLSFGNGTEIQLKTVTGLHEAPTIRGNDVDRPRDQGQLLGLDFYGSRMINLELIVVGSSAADLEVQLAAIDAAFSSQIFTPLPLQFQLPGQAQNRLVNARTRKRTFKMDFNYAAAFMANISIQMICEDPRIYETITNSQTTGLPQPSSGMTFPASFPLTFGGTVGSGGQVTCDNIGNFQTPATIVITGPCTSPRVECSGTGMALSSVAYLTAGQTMTIDTDAHTIISNAANYYFTLRQGAIFANLDPGNNVVSFFSADPSPTGATMQVQWSSAWI